MKVASKKYLIMIIKRHVEVTRHLPNLKLLLTLEISPVVEMTIQSSSIKPDNSIFNIN